MKELRFSLNDNAYWSIIWGFIFLAFLVLVISRTNYSNKKNILIAEAIQNGGDPITIGVTYGKTFDRIDVIMSLIESMPQNK